MKRIKSTILYGLLVASSGLLVTSCADKLDLSPIDYYGSGSYWKTEAQATAYIDGIHKHLRDAAWQHTITFGELRGGRFITVQVVMAWELVMVILFCKILMKHIPE